MSAGWVFVIVAVAIIATALFMVKFIKHNKNKANAIDNAETAVANKIDNTINNVKNKSSDIKTTDQTIGTTNS
jgi:hypothetical protein